MSTAPRSIHELEPIETGGSDARRGFAVQDHVAAGHCLDMLEDPALAQVWCESQDDVTLIWTISGSEEIEFVQVKSNELNQLWSIALLTVPDKGADGKPMKCILEKSLQFDRGKEQSRFRIVTCRPVMDELKVLEYPLGSPHRAKTTKEFTELLKKVAAKLSHIKSDKGNGCEFWVERAFWVCVHSLDSLRNENLIRLGRLVVKQGQFLLPDHLDELYQRLVTRVFDGGLARWDVDAGKKKILRSDLLTWFAAAVTDAVHPGQITAGERLEAKLVEAGVPADQFESIAEMRMQYRMNGLTPKYSDPARARDIEGDISARLHSLRAQLDGAILDNNGALFHATCLATIDSVFNSLPQADRPPLQNLYGYMYNLADRCTHRFVRAKT